ncbi:hypothetical protein CDAR_503281 [Caerostris darwini]|uniref:Uncharacterized protein n=1 Tax=Caerostris darwini TaxID=1538125 RepID=A0AAV4V0Z0_9ARAC|nr:hypothetical protein CDAR_503281 [Caerostris darwini]
MQRVTESFLKIFFLCTWSRINKMRFSVGRMRSEWKVGIIFDAINVSQVQYWSAFCSFVKNSVLNNSGGEKGNALGVWDESRTWVSVLLRFLNEELPLCKGDSDVTQNLYCILRV